jgi:hypothetical protein
VTALEKQYPELRATTLSTPATAKNKFTVSTSSILNFLQLVLLTCQRGPPAGQGYMTLCSQYLSSMPENGPLQDVRFCWVF